MIEHTEIEALSKFDASFNSLTDNSYARHFTLDVSSYFDTPEPAGPENDLIDNENPYFSAGYDDDGFWQGTFAEMGIDFNHFLLGRGRGGKN